ncbi:MAG: ATP-binding protein [Polyangiaceae bacterium]
MLHPLFSRQLARLGIDPEKPPSPEVWAKLLTRISLAYTEADEARYLLERSLEMSSREMQELYERTRKSSEYLIAFERDKLAAVLRSVAAGVLTLDHSERIATLNPEAERLLGFSEAEASGRDARELLGVRRLERSQTGTLSDADFACKRGPPLPVSYALTPLYQGNVEVGGVLVFFDLTERQKVERLKSEFVSTVSHELRTPLTSIRGGLGLLAGGVLGELPSDARDAVAIAHENAERLVRLVNDILDMEKIESGKMDFDLSVHDMSALAAQSVADNRGYADQFGVRLLLAPCPEQALVHTDRHRVLQVLTNLISNAAKFSPSGGAVTVQVSAHDAVVRVEVQDEGQGIPEEFQARIFGKFAQADSSETRIRGGTGLGLAISRSIVEKLGGAIGFTNLPQGGTAFYFAFPESPDGGPSASRGAAMMPR